MAWIKSQTLLGRHRKLAELAKSLRLKPVHTMGHLHALWHAAMEQQEDGILSSWSDDFIAESSMYSGDVPQYVRLLQEHGWLDGKVIHDWLDYAGEFLTKKYKTSNRARLVEIWRAHGRDYGNGQEEEVERKSEGSSRLDKTRLKNSTPSETPEPTPAVPEIQPSEPPKQPEPKPPRKPTGVQDVVRAFKITMKVDENDKAWDKVYFRRYSRPAADLLSLFGGDIGWVCDCIEAVAGKLEKKGLSWTPETIVKHAGDFKNGRLMK